MLDLQLVISGDAHASNVVSTVPLIFLFPIVELLFRQTYTWYILPCKYSLFFSAGLSSWGFRSTRTTQQQTMARMTSRTLTTRTGMRSQPWSRSINLAMVVDPEMVDVGCSDWKRRRLRHPERHCFSQYVVHVGNELASSIRRQWRR